MIYKKRKTQQYQDVEIKKPLYNNFVYIYDRIIRVAIRNKRLLRIKMPQGVGIADPREWIKTGKKMEKVFLRPDEPMILFGNYVIIEKEKTKDEKLEELARMGVFG